MAPRRVWTDDDLLEALRRAASEVPGRFTLMAYREWRGAQPGGAPSDFLAWERFGSWAAAVEEAGLDPGVAWPGRRHWTDETIIGALRAAADEQGRPLRVLAYRRWRYGLPDPRVAPVDDQVSRHFGGWRKAIRAAGVD